MTRAAARMGMSQPAMSNQLRRVESIVGGELFTRSRSGLEPTPLGLRQVISRARTVLSELDNLFGDLRPPLGEDEALALGCVHLACVGSIVARVGDALPGREVSLRIEPSSALLGDALARGSSTPPCWGPWRASTSRCGRRWSAARWCPGSRSSSRSRRTIRSPTGRRSTWST